MTLRKVFVILALGVFAYDLVEDSICLNDQPGAGSAPCCVCARDTHITAPNTPLVVSKFEPVRFVYYKPSVYAFQPLNAIFHPPCLAA